MRLDQEAAEKAYLTTSTEADRLAMAGGVKQATKVLTDNSSGFYLKALMDGQRTLLRNGWRISQPGVVSVTANRGWSPAEIGLTACEDASRVRLLDANDKEVRIDRPRRFVQTLTASRIGSRWKITNGDSTIVKSFDDVAGCKL